MTCVNGTSCNEISSTQTPGQPFERRADLERVCLANVPLVDETEPAGGGETVSSSPISKKRAAIADLCFDRASICGIHICRLLVAMRQAKKTVMTSLGGVFLLSTSLAPYQNPADEHGHDGGDSGVDLSCGGGSGRAVRRE